VVGPTGASGSGAAVAGSAAVVVAGEAGAGSVVPVTRSSLPLGGGPAVIEVVAAAGSEASILGIEAGAPLILVIRTTVDARGRAFEYSRDLFRADRTRITVRVQGSPTTETARLRGRVVEQLPPLTAPPP